MTDPLRQALQGIWSSAAHAWERHADFVVDRGAEVAHAMLDATALRPDERVLELACGPGGVGLAAADLVAPGGEAVLSDIAPEMTAIAAERANARSLVNARIAQIDMENIDFPDASFDVVLSREGLMLVPDPAAAVHEAHRVLVPGGRAVFAVWGPRDLNPWLGMLLDAITETLGIPVPPPGMPGPFSLSEFGKLEELLAAAGFDGVVVREVATPMNAASFDEWWTRMMAHLSDMDVRALLPAVRVPTLVVHHTDDPLFPPKWGKHVADRIPGAKYVELPGRNVFHFVEPWRDSFQRIAEFLTGHQADVADDRVLATLLFTDIVDSTRRAAEMGDRDWRALLDAHDAVVRSQLSRYRGREVNTSGDGFLAMFDGPQRAIRCAMAIRDAVQALGIEIRAGLHTGECEVRGDDIGGIAVHIGARVSALAGPNDVLVSSALRDLVIGSGLEFEERGAHELKGVPGEWRLFGVAST